MRFSEDVVPGYFNDNTDPSIWYRISHIDENGKDVFIVEIDEDDNEFPPFVLTIPDQVPGKYEIERGDGVFTFVIEDNTLYLIKVK